MLCQSHLFGQVNIEIKNLADKKEFCVYVHILKNPENTDRMRN